MIQLDKITVSRSGRTLFRDFSFRINRGDNLILSGDNGSGKTTLLEILYGHLHTRAGKVSYDFLDKRLDWDERFRKRNEAIHYIPSQALREILGNTPEIYYQQRYYSTGVEEISVRDFLGPQVSELARLNLPQAWNIPALLDVPLTTLSNGQIRKTLILRQLIRNVPRIMLLDYPFEGLDAPSRQTLISFIDHLHDEFAIQFIITGHDNHFPKCMNRRVVLKDFEVESDTPFDAHGNVSLSPKRILQSHTSSADQTVVEFRDVEIRYGDRMLLQGFNWQVRRGDRWALTGRNGSGKTTLFSLIYADHPFAYSQPVFLFGRRRGSGESIWDIKKRISYLGPEQMHLMNDFSLQTNAWEYILTRAGKANENKLTEVASFFGVNDILRYPLRALSSGQLQLVHLILFFLDSKELLLLDEPFQFLDPLRKQKVSQYLQTQLDQDSTLILITHDEQDVREWTEQRLDLR